MEGGGAMAVMFRAQGTPWKPIQARPRHTIARFVIPMERLGGLALLPGWRVRLVAPALLGAGGFALDDGKMG